MRQHQALHTPTPPHHHLNIYARARERRRHVKTTPVARSAKRNCLQNKTKPLQIKNTPFARRIRKPANPKEMVCRAKRGCWSTSKRDACKGHKNALLNQTPLANVKKRAKRKVKQGKSLLFGLFFGPFGWFGHGLCFYLNGVEALAIHANNRTLTNKGVRVEHFNKAKNHLTFVLLC